MKNKSTNTQSRKSSVRFFLKSKFIYLTVLFLSVFALSESGCKTQKDEIKPHIQHALGNVKLSDEEYAKVPRANAATAGETLPSSFFLDVPPVAFDQGQQGSCTSCATAGAKSIEDHIQNGMPYSTTSLIYSPSFLYNQAKASADCGAGSTTLANFNVLIQQGDDLITVMGYDPTNCSTQPNSNQKMLAAAHKISSYSTVSFDVATIKQYIYSGLPVIVAFQVDNTFDGMSAASVWSSFTGPSLGRHCTLLYGWDDSKNAFKMLNSWGANWADNGSTWIDFNFLVNGTSSIYGKIFDECYVIKNATVQNNAPVADFDVNGVSTTITQNQSIAFYDRSQNSPTLWQWTFQGGNPATSTQQNPTVSYPNAGNFAVTLQATNSMGNNTKTVTNYVTVNPTAQQWTCGQPFTDPRDGQVYQTININGTCWLAENLRYTNNNSVGIVYGNNPSNYNTYGCLYSFNDVVNGNLAPPGWHIPTYAETQALGLYILTNYNNNGGVLKSTSSLWVGQNVGANDATSFDALPSGNSLNGNFSDLGNDFYMWSSTAQGSGGNGVSLHTNDSGFGGGYFTGSYYLAIRCVHN